MLFNGAVIRPNIQKDPTLVKKMSAINFNKLKYATAKRVYMKYMHEYHFL